MGFSLDDYVDVAERIQNFMDAHPEGSLQQACDPEVVQVGDRLFIKYTAAAFRHPHDPRPGIGTAWEPFPGQTPYTKNSELMNAETAAWGRAIVALGIVANRKLASRQEVRARVEEQQNAMGELAQIVSDEQRLAPLTFLVAAIRAKNKKALPEEQWQQWAGEALASQDDFKKVGEALAQVYKDLGGDVDAVRAQFVQKQQRAAA